MEDDLFTLRAESLIERETNQLGSKGISVQNQSPRTSQRHQLINNGFQTGSMSMKRPFPIRKHTEEMKKYRSPYDIANQQNPFMKTFNINSLQTDNMQDPLKHFSQRHTPNHMKDEEAFSGKSAATINSGRPMLNPML